MWRRRSWRFYFGFPPFGFYFHGLKPLPSKKEYLNMLEEYKKDLEEELKEVEREIEETRKSLQED
jgi:phage-related tail protein